jgi:threonine/homoserine efflux transporter RhtA
VRDLNPAALVLTRTVIAAVILLPLAAPRDELRPLARHWLPLVRTSTPAVAAVLGVVVLGENLTPGVISASPSC